MSWHRHLGYALAAALCAPATSWAQSPCAPLDAPPDEHLRAEAAAALRARRWGDAARLLERLAVREPAAAVDRELAIAYEHLGLAGLAARRYAQVAAAAATPPARRTEAAARVRVLGQRQRALTVVSADGEVGLPEGVVRVNGVPFTPAEGARAVSVLPGEHRVTVCVDGFAPFEERVEVSPTGGASVVVSLRPLPRRVRFRIEPCGARLSLGERDVALRCEAGAAVTELDLTPGRRSFTATATGYHPLGGELVLRPGALPHEEAVALTRLPPPPAARLPALTRPVDRPRGVHAPPWPTLALGGAGLAGLATAGVLGVVRASTLSRCDAPDDAGLRRCDPEVYEQGVGLTTAVNASLAVGATLLATGAVWFVVDLIRHRRPSAARAVAAGGRF